MNYTLFTILVIGFAALYLYIGKKTAKNMENTEDFFLSKRNLGTLSLTLTLFASQLGAGALLGASEGGFKNGWITFFYPLGMGLGLLSLAFIFGPRLKKLGLNTTAEVFENAYQSPRLRQIVSLISVIAMFFILIGQAVGARKFFAAIAPGNDFLFLACWITFILYTVLGGLKAVVKTDIVQTLFIMIILIISFIYSYPTFQKLNLLNISLQSPSNYNISWIEALLMPLLFMAFEQDMGQKCFAAKSPKTITISSIIASGLLILTSSLAIYFGILLQKSGVLTSNKDALLVSVMQFTTPTIATMCFVGILMVILSTANSLLCAISSHICFDFPFFNKNKKSILFSRLSTIVVGLLAMIVSYNFDNILSLFLQSYEFAVCTIFPSILMAMFFKNISKTGCIFSMSVGTVGFFLLPNVIFFIPKVVFLLSISFIAYFLGMLIKKEMNPTLKNLESPELEKASF
jgi:SSS family solute:Na+ symporter